MLVRRHHTDILIAALTLAGVTGWLGAVAMAWFDPASSIVRAVIWFVGGFLAAQLARRIAADLDLGELAIAALVTQLVVFGIHAKQKHIAVGTEMIVAVVVAEAGAILGGLTSRYDDRKHHALLVIGGGAVCFGVSVVAIGIGEIFGAAPGSLVLTGAIGGALLFVVVVPDSAWWHVTVGAGLCDGVLLLAFTAGQSNYAPVVVVMTVFAMVLGAIGGLIGRAVRSVRVPKAESKLPEARQVRD